MDSKKKHSETKATGDDNSVSRIWRKPVITRIEMKRTMFAIGSGADGYTGHI